MYNVINRKIKYGPVPNGTLHMHLLCVHTATGENVKVAGSH